MRVVIVGAGAVGGYFGGRLAAAGNSVHLLARGEHLRALQRHGLRLNSPLGNIEGLSVPTSDDPHGVGPVDVVFIAVKAHDLAAAAAAAQLLIDDDTAVVSLQNGVEAEEELAAALGSSRVLGGVASIEAVIAEPGVIEHRSSFARLTFGELDGTRTVRAEGLLAACRAAGIDARISEDIRGESWREWILSCAFSGLNALCRQPIGVIMNDIDLQSAYRRLLEEMTALARANAIALPDHFVDERLAFSRDRLDPPARSSLLTDLQRGKRLEIEALNGHAVRLGRRLGVAMPANEVVYAALKAYRAGSP